MADIDLTPTERLALHTALDWCYPPTDEDIRRAVDHAAACDAVERILADRATAPPPDEREDR